MGGDVARNFVIRNAYTLLVKHRNETDNLEDQA